MTKIFGKRWIVKLFVHFRRVLHFEQVGISSPSKTSSFMNRSRQSLSLQRVFDGNGRLRSQKGSKLTLVFSHTVHLRVLFNWPENRSLITEFSVFEYQFHIKSDFFMSLLRKVEKKVRCFGTMLVGWKVSKQPWRNFSNQGSSWNRLVASSPAGKTNKKTHLIVSSIVIGSAFVAVFNALCAESKKKRKNSCESCCADPEYMRNLLANAVLKSDGLTLRLPARHICLIKSWNSEKKRKRVLI